MKVRLHLARCGRCGRKVAWSVKRQHWLALAPLTDLPGRRLTRRMRCPDAATGGHHDPQLSPLKLARTLLGGAR